MIEKEVGGMIGSKPSVEGNEVTKDTKESKKLVGPVNKNS